ncbi:MAG: PspC domain-containing protein [Bacteroidaceae bacterium]|nr:PspC domain-containing protein [Bacteroidaceae bacterium]
MDKKFALSATDKKIAGVCGGIAEYFGMDSLLVRILFVVLLLGGSLGFWAYILLWILAPKNK